MVPSLSRISPLLHPVLTSCLNLSFQIMRWHLLHLLPLTNASSGRRLPVSTVIRSVSTYVVT